MLAKSFFSLFLLFVIAPFGAAQVNRNSSDITYNLFLRGKIRTQSEAPVTQARVELRRMTGEVVGLMITNDEGRYDFTMLAPGEYVLTVTCPGYETLSESVSLQLVNMQNHIVYLNRNAKPAEASQPAVSVRELSLPDKAINAFRKGSEMLYDKRNLAASIKQFQEALRHYSDYYEAYFQIGVAYTQMRRLDDAVAAFEKSLQLSGHRYAPPLIGLAALANERGQFQDAAGLAQRAIDLDEDRWQAHYELGRAMLGLNNVAAAEKALNQTRAQNPHWPALYLLFANVHIRQNDPHAVQSDLQEYLRLEPQGPHAARARELLEQVGIVLAQSREPAGANKP